MFKLILTAGATALLAACAAQSYARLEPVADAEALSCERIEAETVRTQGFLHEVRSGRKPWWTPAQIVNAGERRAAARSARTRLAQLQAARRILACPAPLGA